MAYQGKTIFNVKTGIETKFLVLMNRFSRVFRLTKPLYAVQRLAFGILGLAAWVMGYRGWKEAYVD